MLLFLPIRREDKPKLVVAAARGLGVQIWS